MYRDASSGTAPLNTLRDAPVATPSTNAPHKPSAHAAAGLPMPARFWSVLVILLGLGMCVLDGSLVLMILPAIAKGLQISDAETIWIISGYQVALLCLMLPIASLGEKLGQKKIYLIGVAAFSAAALIAVFSQNLLWLVLGRTLQGVFSATIMTSTAVLMRRTYPASILGRGIALNALVVGSASVAGPAVASVLMMVFSWQWLFALPIPFAFAIVWLGLRYLPNDPKHLANEPISWLDVLLNIGMFGLVFWGFKMFASQIAKSDLGAGHWMGPVGLMAAGIAVGVFYVHRQKRMEHPMLPLDLLRIPVFSLSVCASVSAFAAQMLSFVALPFLLLVSRQLTGLEAAIMISIWPLASVATAPISGRLIGKFSSATLGFVGMMVFALGLFCMALLPEHASHVNTGWRLVICGIGFALFQSPNNHTIITSGPIARTGAAGGMLSGSRLTGQAIGAAIAAGVFVWYPPAINERGLVICFAGSVAFAVVAAFFSLSRVRTGAHKT